VKAFARTSALVSCASPDFVWARASPKLSMIPMLTVKIENLE
jgi:hypothetical protein